MFHTENKTYITILKTVLFPKHGFSQKNNDFIVVVGEKYMEKIENQISSLEKAIQMQMKVLVAQHMDLKLALLSSHIYDQSEGFCRISVG